MSIEFMILSAPRSGSTWASNWLTTDTTLCLHDPLMLWTKDELFALESPKRLGVSCTGLALFPNVVNAHPARKVILHRPMSEIDDSLTRVGLSSLGPKWEGVLDKIEGVHVDWRELFTRPKEIYEYLLDLPFDAERWAALRHINVQPNFSSLTVNAVAAKRLMEELRLH